jgi:hypothetical protein
MVRLLFGLGILAVAFSVYAIVDCLLADRRRIRGLPKAVWVLVILIVMPIGGILWFAVGRGRRGATARGSAARGPVRRVAPDDDPAFLKGLGSQADQDERIRRLERELAELDSDKDTKKDNGSDGSDKPDRKDA